jgi:hypothetical protein
LHFIFQILQGYNRVRIFRYNWFGDRHDKTLVKKFCKK